MTYEVITLGETMLRLTPPGLELLETVRSLEAHVGGSESNTSVALARLGSRVAWLSRLPDNPLADLVCGELTRYGVDTRYVVRAPGERIGVYYHQQARAPRSSQVYYDRADSAMARMQPDQLPSEPFQSGSARLFHTSGITLAISQSARKTAEAALEQARQARMKISFDVNHRRNLWSNAEAQQACQPWLTTADLVFVAERDIALIWPDCAGDPEAFHRYCPQAVLIVTRGAEGSLALTPDGNQHRQSAYQGAEVDRLGRGDAFSAGFIHHWLAEGDVPEALRWGAATAALKGATPGDMALIHRHEVERLLELGDRASDIQR